MSTKNAPILTQVLDALIEKEMLNNQTELGKALDLTKGYVSALMRQEELPERVRIDLSDKFGISREWLDSSGMKGSVWPKGLKPKDFAYIESLEKQNKRTLTFLEAEKKENKRLLALLDAERKEVIRLKNIIEKIDRTVTTSRVPVNKKSGL